MKKIWVFYFIAVVLVVVVAGFFVLGVDGMVGYSEKYFLGFFDSGNTDVVSTGVVGEAGGGFSGAGGGDSSTGEPDSGSVCEDKQVQYSLRNFDNNIWCLSRQGEVCISMVANCSFDVYNFDDGDGVFGVEYSLVNSQEEVLDLMLVEKYVDAGEHEIFYSDFVWDDSEGVDEDLSCPFVMKSIPMKNVCN